MHMSQQAGGKGVAAHDPSSGTHDEATCTYCIPPTASLFEMAARRKALAEKRSREAMAREAGMEGEDIEAFIEMCKDA